MSAEAASPETTGRAAAPTRLIAGRISIQTAILVAAVVVGGIGILWLGRPLGFYGDEWTFLSVRQGGGLDTYLRPHNGHLSLIPVLVYKTLWSTVGLGHYWPYRLSVLITHLACVVLVYVLVRRRLGGWAALIPAFLLLFMSASAENILLPFQLSQVGALAFGLGAFVLLDQPSKRRDIWACILITASLATAGMGIPILLGVAVEVLLEPGRRRRWWIFAVPLGLYLLWRAGYSDGSDAIGSNVQYAVQYVVDAASAAAAGITGLAAGYGPVILAGGIGAVAILRRGDARAPLPSPRLAALLVAGLGFWTLTAVTRAQFHEPGAPRYISFGAIVLMLVAAEMLPAPQRWTPWMTATAVVVVVGLTFGNLFHLRDSTRFLRGIWEPLRGELAGIEVGGAASRADLLVDPRATEILRIGSYLAATRRFGSASGGLGWLAGKAPESRRQAADAAVARAEGIVPLAPANGPQNAAAAGAVLTVEEPTGGALAQAGRCITFTPSGSGAPSFVVRIHPGDSVSVTTGRGSPVGVQLRRFAERFTVTPTPIAAPGSAIVRTVRDKAPGVDWHLYVAAQQRVRTCPA